MTAPADGVRMVPADEASWEDLQRVLDTRGESFRCQCQCQRYELPPRESFAAVLVDQRAEWLRDQVHPGRPAATTGLVAYLDAEPVGWCAVEPARRTSVRCVTARGLEADPITSTDEISMQLHVGLVDMLVAAGLRQVGAPTSRRVVTCLELRVR